MEDTTCRQLLCCLVTLLLVVVSVQSAVAAANIETIILVNDWAQPGRILNVSLKNLNFTSLPIDDVKRPVALDYDPEANVVYWTDVFNKQIRRKHLSSEEDNVLVQLNKNATPDGIAVDTEDGLVFYTDAGNNLIARVRHGGQELEVTAIVDDNLHEPRAIAVHSTLKRLYWTDWGESPKIETSTYNGSDRATVVDRRLIWPNGIAVDSFNDLLYWCDAKRSVIEVVRVDGSDRRVVLSESTAHYFDIFINRGMLYFTDWSRPKALLHVPTCGGKVGYLTSKGFHQLAGLYVIGGDPEADANYTLPECNNTCTHCLNSTGCDRLTARCPYGCEEGWAGDTCSDQAGLESGSGATSETVLFTLPAKEEETTDSTQVTVTNKTAKIKLNEIVTTSKTNPVVHPVSGKQRPWFQLSPGMIASVVLGCLTVLLMMAIILLLVIRKHRMKNDNNLLVEWRREQAFTNNTYTLMAGDMEDHSQIYLVPCEDTLASFKPDDHLYEDIDELKK